MAVDKQINQYPAAITVDGAADYLLIDVGGTGTYNKINRNVLLGITSTPIGASDSQTLQNKTLDNTNIITVKDGNFTIQNASDTTKRAIFSAAGITTGTTRTLTLPNRTDTLVTLAGSETLTNKTITSPTITGGTIDNAAITVDSISGHTSATIVTVGGVQMSNGVVNTANAVTAVSIAAGAVQPQALAVGTGTGWAWSSWTPIFTNLTEGNGTKSAKYIQIGKTVFAKYGLTMGNTSSVSGDVTFTLPVTSVALSTSSNLDPIGQVTFFDGGTSISLGLVSLNSTTAGNIRVWNSAGTYLLTSNMSVAIPYAYGAGSATGKTISFLMTYEAA